MLEQWLPLFSTLVLFVALWWTSRQLAYFFTGVFLLLTRSESAARILYAIFILPGTIIHETSHWLMARLVGVRTGQVSIFPTFDRKGAIRLGSVQVKGGGLLQHTLIGLAPLLVGSILTVWLSYGLVEVKALAHAAETGQWQAIAGIIRQTLLRQDALLGLYLLFTVSDAMFLSASDRAPIQQTLLYLALVLTPLYFLGLLPSLPPEWTDALRLGFTVFGYGLLIALMVHAALMVLFGLLFYTLLQLARAR
ncbi:MAG: hypothetical protein D6775_12340 [Caldilineae bacterium]|nr:MAG: hypothetical protein D6775_12340 [Caldilineae bacterium]